MYFEISIDWLDLSQSNDALKITSKFNLILILETKNYNKKLDLRIELELTIAFKENSYIQEINFIIVLQSKPQLLMS